MNRISTHEISQTKAPTKEVKKKRKTTLKRTRKAVFARLNKCMKKRRPRICGMRDGTANVMEMNGCQFKDKSGFIVNHAGMLICGGKMTTRKKDFPTQETTAKAEVIEDE